MSNVLENVSIDVKKGMNLIDQREAQKRLQQKTHATRREVELHSRVNRPSVCQELVKNTQNIE
jgi:hypothetical protein